MEKAVGSFYYFAIRSSLVFTWIVVSSFSSCRFYYPLSKNYHRHLPELVETRTTHLKSGRLRWRKDKVQSDPCPNHFSQLLVVVLSLVLPPLPSTLPRSVRGTASAPTRVRSCVLVVHRQAELDSSTWTLGVVSLCLSVLRLWELQQWGRLGGDKAA